MTKNHPKKAVEGVARFLLSPNGLPLLLKRFSAPLFFLFSLLAPKNFTVCRKSVTCGHKTMLFVQATSRRLAAVKARLTKHAPRRTALYLIMATSLGFGLAAMPVASVLAQPYTVTINSTFTAGNGHAYGNSPDGTFTSLDNTSLTGNTLNIVDGASIASNRHAYGALGINADVTGNTVNMTGGSVGGDVIGGSVSSADAVRNNKVFISGGTVGGTVIGGGGWNGAVTGNEVEISGNAQVGFPMS